MSLQHRVLLLWRLKQVILHGSLPKSGVKTFLALQNTHGNLWQRNIILGAAGLPRMLHLQAGNARMQRNRHGSYDGNHGDIGQQKEDRLSLPEGLITNTPQSIQVFADPTLTKSVRDLATDMQKVKTTLKFNKEEVADCVYEYIRLNTSYDSLKTTVKETSQLAKELTRETEGNAKSFNDKHKELEKCLLYFTEKTVQHENQMREISKCQEEIVSRLEEFVANLDFVTDEISMLSECVHRELKPEIEGATMLAKILGADDGSLQVDVKKITEDLSRIRTLLNDGDWIEDDRHKKPKAVDSEGEGYDKK